MFNRLLKILPLSLVAVILLAQVVDQTHLHINDPADSMCDVCRHSDTTDATLAEPFQPASQTAVAVEFHAAVSAALAARRWARLSRAPPLVLA